MKKRIITLLLLGSVYSFAQADELQLQPNHPERYVVVKGDTLWDISGKFLKDPWRWPQIWKMNRTQIKNPHWIYPGDVVVLDKSGGDPQLRLLRQTVTLEPGIIVEPLEQTAIPTISPSIISPFLSQPLLVEEGELKDTPEIIASPDDRLVLGAGYRAYVDSLEESEGQTWQIYREGKPLVDPETEETLGHEAVYLGDAQVVRFGEPATITITRSKEEIAVSDRLLPAPDRLMGSFVPHAPDEEIDARIMTSYGGEEEIVRNSIVTINRGNRDGLEEGHVLAIYNNGEKILNKKKQVDPRDYVPEVNIDVQTREDGIREVNLVKDNEDDKYLKLPDERVGLLMVFRTFDHVSYGLVMQSERPIHLNDAVRKP